MTGLYHLPFGYVCEDLVNFNFEQVKASMENLVRVGFCEYDYKKKYVWVRNMLKYQTGERIEAGDKRSKAISKRLESIFKLNLSFFDKFLEQYQESHCIVI
jgi:hypothetical protein